MSDYSFVVFVSDQPLHYTGNHNVCVTEPMTEVIKKPERPHPDECCGEGCCPCIWDVYYNALGRWQEQQEKLQQRPVDTGDASQ